MDEYIRISPSILVKKDNILGFTSSSYTETMEGMNKESRFRVRMSLTEGSDIQVQEIKHTPNFMEGKTNSDIELKYFDEFLIKFEKLLAESKTKKQL